MDLNSGGESTLNKAAPFAPAHHYPLFSTLLCAPKGRAFMDRTVSLTLWLLLEFNGQHW